MLQRMNDEIRRDMILLGCKNIKDLSKRILHLEINDLNYEISKKFR